MPTRGDEPASTSAGAVSQREVAALVYNYLRSNGFVKATEQFKKDADALLAPFGNRIPAGVKGLDAVLSEYVAFKEADTKRKRAVASNPLAKRMYDVLEECAAGIAPSPRDGGDADAVADANVRRPSDPERVPAFPSPSSAAMPPPPARSPHRGKKRGGGVPRRNAPVGAPAAGPTRDQSGGGVNGGGGQRADKEAASVFGSLDDVDAASWRNYELPRALNDARVQERLAAVIAERIPTLDSDGLSEGVFGKRREDALFAGFNNKSAKKSEDHPFASPEKRKSPRRKSPSQGRPGAGFGGSPSSGAGVRDGEDVGGLDVDAVMQSLFENDADGTLGEILGPLLGMPSGKDRVHGSSPFRENGDVEKNKHLETSKDALKRRSEGNEAVKKKSRADARASVPAHVRALDVDAFVKSIEY